MKLNKKQLLANYELGTYLDGLRDALKMTRAELIRAIDTIVNSDEL